jgi:hypothetical protein
MLADQIVFAGGLKLIIRNWIPLIFVGFQILGGCGYQLQGAATLNEPTLEVPIFENRTIETGIEAQVTERFLEQLRQMPGWKVVLPGKGRYILKGTVLVFGSEVVGVDPREVANRMRAELILDVSLWDRSTGENLWREPALRNFSNYQVEQDILQSERNKFLAIGDIAEKLATRVRKRINNTW